MVLKKHVNAPERFEYLNVQVINIDYSKVNSNLVFINVLYIQRWRSVHVYFIKNRRALTFHALFITNDSSFVSSMSIVAGHNTSYIALASHAFGFVRDGWFKLEGDFTTLTHSRGI